MFAILSTERDGKVGFRGRKRDREREREEDITRRYRPSLRNIACKNIQRRASPLRSVNSIYRMIKHLTLERSALRSVGQCQEERKGEGKRKREREGETRDERAKQQGERETAENRRRRDGGCRMRQPERSGYSSAREELFLFSFPLFLSRKPTASPYKLPFVPLISPWPLVRTYLIRINARAA